MIRRRQPRAVEIIIDLTHYVPPHWTNTRLDATHSAIRIDNRHVGRIVSPLEPLGNGHAHALAIVTLTDRELETAFPLGYIIDPHY